MLRLDYLSCLLTIASTVMVGKRMWHGWLVAGANSVIISAIGMKTGQWGFVPANLFCIAIYAYNVASWRKKSPETAASATLNGHDAAQHRPRRFALRSKIGGDDRPTRNRIRPRTVPNHRESHTSQ
jgi:hypothetical protein